METLQKGFRNSGLIRAHLRKLLYMLFPLASLRAGGNHDGGEVGQDSLSQNCLLHCAWFKLPGYLLHAKKLVYTNLLMFTKNNPP